MLVQRLYLQSLFIWSTVNETNRYALQNEALNRRRSSGDQRWKPTDVQEMIKFLGLNI